MWFKNAIFYRFSQPFEHTVETLEAKLEDKAFTPCSSQELSRFGWISPSHGLSDMLVHAGQGFMLIAAQKEEKSCLPLLLSRSWKPKLSRLNTSRPARFTVKNAIS
nr:recombination-associated protein RdgC [Aliamphritea spongicola]